MAAAAPSCAPAHCDSSTARQLLPSRVCRRQLLLPLAVGWLEETAQPNGPCLWLLVAAQVGAEDGSGPTGHADPSGAGAQLRSG